MIFQFGLEDWQVFKEALMHTLTAGQALGALSLRRAPPSALAGEINKTSHSSQPALFVPPYFWLSVRALSAERREDA